MSAPLPSRAIDTLMDRTLVLGYTKAGLRVRRALPGWPADPHPGGLVDKHVLVVEDVIDSGLTLNWLLRNIRSRQPASVEVCALLRKPDAAKVEIPVKYVGFDIATQFVVGYGLDYAERYRDLPFVGLLKAAVYEGS